MSREPRRVCPDTLGAGTARRVRPGGQSDIDNDGRLDLLIRLKLVGTKANRSAIGAKRRLDLVPPAGPAGRSTGWLTTGRASAETASPRRSGWARPIGS